MGEFDPRLSLLARRQIDGVMDEAPWSQRMLSVPEFPPTRVIRFVKKEVPLRNGQEGDKSTGRI
jgi:hypothetical protein